MGACVEERDCWRAGKVFVCGSGGTFAFYGVRDAFFGDVGERCGGGGDGGFVAFVSRGEVVFEGVHVWWEFSDFTEC